MDYVARAKALLSSKARTGALLVLPLAAAVQHAQATTAGNSYALPTGNFQCQETGTSSGSCPGSDAQLPVQNGLAGVKFFGTDSIYYNFYNGNPYYGTGLENFILSSSGPLTGHSGGSLPTGTTLTNRYDFTLAPGFSGGFISSWRLTYSLVDTTTKATLFSDSSVSGGFISGGSGGFSGSFTDKTNAPLIQGDNYAVTTEISVSGGGYFYLNIPGGGSFDIGSNAQAPSAPEPGTLGLGGLGLALAGIWRGLRRKRRTGSA